jgi:regulatory protein
VRVELDGAPWRTIPTEVAARAGIRVDEELDRSRLGVLARELRRSRALATASGALARRDHSTRSLEERLERRGIGPTQRRETIETLERVGYLDDPRFGATRAQALAARGAGDAAIAADLEHHGLEEEVIRDALGTLEPEERRAEQVVSARGLTAATLRHLARRGFAEELVAELAERLVAADAQPPVG